MWRNEVRSVICEDVLLEVWRIVLDVEWMSWSVACFWNRYHQVNLKKREQAQKRKELEVGDRDGYLWNLNLFVLAIDAQIWLLDRRVTVLLTFHITIDIFFNIGVLGLKARVSLLKLLGLPIVCVHFDLFFCLYVPNSRYPWSYCGISFWKWSSHKTKNT